MENNKPICKFESDEQFNQCVKYWQNKLFLDHWVIKAILVPKDIVLDDGTICDGRNKVMPASRVSYIEVSQDYNGLGGMVERHCEELVLVHELLHCKYNYLRNTDESIESVEYDICEHGKLHEMARTLLMVKYGIDLDWFKIFKGGDD